MLSIYHIRLLINECREMSRVGFFNDHRVAIPHLEIDVVLPGDFIGANNNPAIFVNSMTFKRLSKFHTHWIENGTLVFQKSFLQKDPIDIIGAVIHETGHAFNVAANLPNTEVNAYIYEIEILRQLYLSKSPLLFDCSLEDVRAYFHRRLVFYAKDSPHSPELRTLIEEITTEFELQEDKHTTPEPEQLAMNISSFFFQNKEQDNMQEVSAHENSDEISANDNLFL